ASDIIYHELKTFKASRKVPIVASIMDLGTSGGYYIAAAADTVLAHPSSVTGSIGVIMLTMNARGLLEKVGVEIKRLADGRIYTGEQAKEAGLVDEIGYLEDAVELAKKKAGLTEARVVTYQRPGEYSNNVYSKLLAPSGLAGLADLDLMTVVRGGAPQFMYMWMP
ncbi:MAG: S49 family peptidase, partial [Nitrospirota bacterium]